MVKIHTDSFGSEGKNDSAAYPFCGKDEDISRVWQCPYHKIQENWIAAIRKLRSLLCQDLQMRSLYFPVELPDLSGQRTWHEGVKEIYKAYSGFGGVTWVLSVWEHRLLRINAKLLPCDAPSNGHRDRGFGRSHSFKAASKVRQNN